jgi:hypothetical protein
MSPEMFRRLAALGLNHEQMAGVLEIIDEREAATAAKEEDRKAQIRARVQKFRSKNKTETLRNVTDQSVTLRNGSREGDARVEDNLQTKNSTGQKENKKTAALSDLTAFKSDLERDASAEQVEAFAKHRKAKNGQNSAYAARLFRRDAEACGLSVAEAIDTAISRGWLTVKPDYLAGRQRTPQAQATAPPKQTVGQQARDELKRMGMTNAPDQGTRHFDPSDGGSGFAGTGIARRIAIASSR